MLTDRSNKERMAQCTCNSMFISKCRRLLGHCLRCSNMLTILQCTETMELPPMPSKKRLESMVPGSLVLNPSNAMIRKTGTKLEELLKQETGKLFRQMSILDTSRI